LSRRGDVLDSAAAGNLSILGNPVVPAAGFCPLMFSGFVLAAMNPARPAPINYLTGTIKRAVGARRICNAARGRDPCESVWAPFRPAPAWSWPGVPARMGRSRWHLAAPPASGMSALLRRNPTRPRFVITSLASPAEGIGDGEHEEFGERDTLNQEKRAVSAEYP
jgi:hypothetical protein